MLALIVRQSEVPGWAFRLRGHGPEKEAMRADAARLEVWQELSRASRKEALEVGTQVVGCADGWVFPSPFYSTGRSLEKDDRVLFVENERGLALLGHDDEEHVLVKDQPSATFEMLLKKAEQDGRLTGKYRCPVCGMRYKREREASACCYGIAK